MTKFLLVVATFMLAGCSGCAAIIADAMSGTVSPTPPPSKEPAKKELEQRPYVTSYPASLGEDPRDPYQKMYFSRPRPVTLAATLHNPFQHDVVATVFCPGNVLDGHSTRNLLVRGHGERRFLVEVMSPRMHEGCVVDFFHFVGLPGPDPDL